MAAIEPGGGIVTGHFRETDAYAVSRPSGRADWLLTYTLAGEGYYRTREGERRCGAGELALLRKGVPHEYGTSAGQIWNFMWAHFPGMPETGLLPEAEVLIARIPGGAMQRRVLRVFRSVLSDSRVRGEFWEELCLNQLSGLLLLMAGQLADRLDPRISRVVRLLSAHMQEPLTIEELAGRVGLSASRLSHLFKAETGRSIVETLNGMRLEQAALLMKQAGRTATEAAYDVGFMSYNHFAALFRRRFGCSPADYRRQN